MKAPAQVDTLRVESCPVCGDDEGYSGDRCSVCGYMQPPSQFTDPDLTKAREQDLRQEQQEALPMNPGPDRAQEGGDLQCDQCGEVFSAEGDATTEAETDVETGQAPDDDTEDEESSEIDPTDLADLAEVDDDALFDDEAEEDPSAGDNDEAEDDPFVDEDLGADSEADDVDPINSGTDPAVGEGRITAEPEGSETTLDAPLAAGQTCPVCGEGTLSPPATSASTDGKEPKLNEVGTDPTKQSTASCRG